jgi:hypothetical protein
MLRCSGAGALALLAAGGIAGCQNAQSAPPVQTAPAQAPAPYYAPGYPPAAYGAPSGYAQAPGYAPPPTYSAPPTYAGTSPVPMPAYSGAPPAAPGYAPAPTPVIAAPPGVIPPAATPASSARPLLGPIVGSVAWQGEVHAVVRELVANLSPANAARVATIPLVFDPNPNEINAFAGCDDNGAPFVAGTEGLLEAVDAIAETKATDELYGTQTYAAYINAVVPRLATSSNASAALTVGIIPPQYWVDLRRISRAHEIFDEIVAFTFGHELSHHYLGHTGCANGQPVGGGPAIAELGQLAASILPGLNQPNEILADTNGCINTLDTGKARASRAYRWSEEGGLFLLDFFARLEAASGQNPLLGFLRTHPNPGLRIPIVQTVAATWRFRNPG